MHKDELLQLHSLLCQVKRFFDEAGLQQEGEFNEYRDLAVSPQHIHKSKTDHKRAVFLLGKGLADLVMADNQEQQARLRERFLRLAEVEVEAEVAPEPIVREAREELPAFALAALGR